MKKTLLSLFFIAAGFVGISQTITVDTSGIDINETTLEFTYSEITSTGNYRGDVYIEITNTATSSIEIQVRRTNQSLECSYTFPTGHMMCLGVLCYQGDIIPSATNTKQLLSGETIELHIQIQFDPVGKSTEFYEVYEKDNEANNLVSFTIKHESLGQCGVSVDNISNNLVIKTYPNPANNLINFNYLNISNNSYITIHDITGKEVGNVNLNANMNSVAYNTSKLQAGIYFYNVFVDGIKTKTNKFIIRH